MSVRNLNVPGRRLTALLSKPSVGFAAVCLTHLVVGLIYKEVVGLDIQANPGGRAWDWWWQTVPADLLVGDLWRSLFFMHAQPPLFNLYGAAFFHLFPSEPMSAMHLANIALGSLLSGMIYLILRQLSEKWALSLAVGLILALDPGLFLFEAYMLYDLLTAFLVVGSVFLLASHIKTGRLSYALLFILSLNFLVLTRSAYHLVIVVVGLALVVLASRRNRARILIGGFVISLLGLGWYAKNDILYGFFGASSWQGFGLWKVASQGYSREELFDLRDAGVIAPLAAEVEVLRPASAYAPYGFTRTSSIPVIGRDDRQNINLVGVAQVYQESALRLIELNPTRQLAAMMNSYRIFNIPSAEFKHHALNAPRIPFSVWLASRILQGGILDDYLPRPIGSAFFFLIPLSILVYGVGLIASLRSGVRKLDEYLRRRSLDTWIAFLIGYTTMVSVLFEVGENNREKFYIEQLVIVFLIAAFSRLVAWVQRRRPSGVAVPVPGSGNGL